VVLDDGTVVVDDVITAVDVTGLPAALVGSAPAANIVTVAVAAVTAGGRFANSPVPVLSDVMQK